MSEQRTRLTVLAIVLALLTCLNAGAQSSTKRIAFTFDDAPRSADSTMSAQERTNVLIDALADGGIEGAIFFVTTGNLDRRGEQGAAILRQYAAAGHVLANHSHTHQSANALEPDAFVADISKAHARLKEFEGYAPYMRFPFLHEGRPKPERDAIRAGLTALGLKQGYVTVDNYDWYLQALFSQSTKSGSKLQMDGWRKLYIDTLMGAIRRYDAFAENALGRSPAHVLLLHENDLAALFVDDLANALRTEGWEIVSALEAYQDPIADTLPDTLFLGQGRVAALAAESGMSPRDLRDPLESEAALRALAVKRGLVDLAPGAYLNQPPPGIVPERFAPDVISLSEQYEYGTTFAADGREMFFGVAIDGRGEIRTTRFADGDWTIPETVLSHPEYEFADPFLSSDGTRLYFITTQPEADEEATGTHDIAYVRRTRDGWSAPIRLKGHVNTVSSEYFVSFTDDGTLAFASNINAESASNFDIYLSEPGENGYSTPVGLVGKATTGAYEADPFIAADGSYILFSSTRRSGQGKRDIYVTFRQPDDTWSRAISLGARVNTAEIEFCPFVSRDGRFLFYTSNEDIYWVDASVIDIAREQLAKP
ncbi:MAG: polysaccharide deacetylase family protein [Pseudomonadota bacterium]